MNKNQLCDVNETTRVITNPIERGIERLSLVEEALRAAKEADRQSTKKVTTNDKC
jgi:hypothetical protein